jgi:hypothetical protein
MIYLSTWAVIYADPRFDDMDRFLATRRIVKPTFFKDEERVLVCMTDHTPVNQAYPVVIEMQE